MHYLLYITYIIHYIIIPNKSLYSTWGVYVEEGDQVLISALVMRPSNYASKFKKFINCKFKKAIPADTCR